MATDITTLPETVQRLYSQLGKLMDLTERQMDLIEKHQVMVQDDPTKEPNAHDLGWTMQSLCQAQGGVIEAIQDAMGNRRVRD